jgi:SAM-dependent methyltransferase
VDARLLGDVADRDVLEIGCGAAQGARWLTAAGAKVTAFDVSSGQLRESRRLDERSGVRVTRLVQADAQRLPFRSASFDVVMSAFGGIPFVADSARVMREVARVLRPGGRLVFSVTHPVRWAFPDDPGPAGLTAQQSYFDRTPYVEVDDRGEAAYVEHHRTLGDRVRELVAAGLVLDDVVEPEWPEDHDREWGQWSPLDLGGAPARLSDGGQSRLGVRAGAPSPVAATWPATAGREQPAAARARAARRRRPGSTPTSRGPRPAGRRATAGRGTPRAARAAPSPRSPPARGPPAATSP